MTEREALMRNVIERPDDDLPRLVLADWLDEHDEPERAEFIRVQCEVAKAADSRPDLVAREKELLTEHGHLWAEEFGGQIDHFVYRRGFIEQCEMSVERPADEILGLLNRLPIRHIRDTGQFCDFAGFVAALDRIPTGRLLGLEFWNLYAFDNALLRDMLASVKLGSLRTLILHHDRNGNLASEGVIADALGSKRWAKLETLGVNIDGMWRGPSPRIMNVMADSPHLRRLKRLLVPDLSNVGHRPSDNVALFRRFGQSKNFDKLEELDLRSGDHPEAVWREILRWPFLPKLKRLWMTGSRMRIPPHDHGGWVAELPEWRAAFDFLNPNIDWTTTFVDPWSCDTFETGLSWGSRKKAPLFAMSRFVKAGDWDGLEAEYRKRCRKAAGLKVTREVEAVPFADYERRLETAYRRAVRAANSRPDGAIYMRLRPDIQWMSQLHVHTTDDINSGEPFEEFSYSGESTEIEGPRLEAAGELLRREQHAAGVRVNWPGLYLIARTLALFGRLAHRHPLPVPVYFSCIYLAIRVATPEE